MNLEEDYILVKHQLSLRGCFAKVSAFQSFQEHFILEQMCLLGTEIHKILVLLCVTFEIS